LTVCQLQQIKSFRYKLRKWWFFALRFGQSREQANEFYDPKVKEPEKDHYKAHWHDFAEKIYWALR
jgi:hypothetical protein